MAKKVIVSTSVEQKDYFSSIFTREKDYGTFRMIINLKNLNKDIDTNHFKMESIKNVLSMITENAYMASVDLKDAFFSVPVTFSHQKYLKFVWNQPYKFQVMPNRYADAMRVFTKLLVFSHL